MSEYHDTLRFISALGDGMILSMYLLLVRGWIHQNNWLYIICNLFGSALVLCDVVADFSFTQLFVLTGWLVVSSSALVSALHARRHLRTKSKSAANDAANDAVLPDSDSVIRFCPPDKA